MIDKKGRVELAVLPFYYIVKMIVKEYELRLRENRCFSENTVKNYIRTIWMFDKYLKKITFSWGVDETKNIKLAHVNWFIQNQKIRWINTRTCNNYLAAIKNFFRFCLICDYEALDYKKIIFSREEERKIDSLTDDEAKKLLYYFKSIKCITEKEEIIKTRNLCICQLLLYTWLRVSELSNLKVRDIKNQMQIIGKWWKVRPIFLTDEDIKLIDLYLYLRNNNSEYLFISHSSNSLWHRLSKESIEKIIREWWKEIWIEVFPHKLRHTFATNLLWSWVQLSHIQYMLWHNSLLTTQKYLTVLNSELEKSHNMIKRY